MATLTGDHETAAERPTVAALRTRPNAQVLIIGGGINGISTFRDLALQGIDVALVERSDFASGASAGSSHMIHGGIRYLENGEFRLVEESVHERNALVEIAPHYVRLLKTTVPIFSTFKGLLSAPLTFFTHKKGKPTERGALLIKVGLVLYDAYSRGDKKVPRHQFFGRKRSLQQLPKLNPTIKYTATYFDASMHNPERLALDVLLDGLAEGDHARASNYVSAVGVEDDGVLLRDERTGEEFVFHADVVVNASGPWTDLTNDALRMPTRFMGGTKGSHIVLDHPELLAATGDREMFFEHADGRIVLIHPIGDRVLVGTSDLEHDINDPIVCTEDEVDYFLGLIPHVFPSIPVDRSHIVYRFAGVRPLPRHDDAVAGTVSRDYSIQRARLGNVPVLSLVGGKWTTFRALGEQLSDDILAELGAQRTISTDGRAIGGGKGFPRDARSRTAWVQRHRDTLSAQRADALLARYGTRAAELIDHLAEVGDDALVTLPGYSRQELAWLAGLEYVVTLSDLVLRRTNIAFTGGANAATLSELAGVLAEALGWSADEAAAQVEATETLLETEHGYHRTSNEQAADEHTSAEHATA